LLLGRRQKLLKFFAATTLLAGDYACLRKSEILRNVPEIIFAKKKVSVREE